jgi:hypothetical protein
MGTKTRDGFEARFEGAALLTELLAVAGCHLSLEEIVDGMRAARQDGASPGEVIPTLFEAEPRFPNPQVARHLYENLLGLWELAGQEGPLKLDGPAAEPLRRPKKAPPPPKPPAFGFDGPDAEYVERAWRYLDTVDDKGRMPLEHAFENRQDALLVELESKALSDAAFSCARQLLFELFAMIELGWPTDTEKVVTSPSPALTAYCEQVLAEAELEEDALLRETVAQGLTALWGSRLRRK